MLPAVLCAVDPGRPVLLDAFADPLGSGGYGTAFLVDRDGDPAANATAFAAHADLYLVSSAAFEASGDLLVLDAEADPSGLGVVVGGGDGPGALFRADGASGQVGLLSDGSDYVPGLPGGTDTIFVEPAGLAVLPDGTILVADLDADPSGFGEDPQGLPGHGALLSVDPATGQVDLVSDGSIAPGGLPPGEESVLVDPIGVAVAPDGTIFLLDALADPLGLGRRGAVFQVEAGGSLLVAASPPEFRLPSDLAVLPDGRIVVADAAAGASGAVLVLDPADPDPGAPAVVLAEEATFRGPSGLAVAPNGWVFLTDEFADPLGLARLGALYRIDARSGEVRVVSADAAYQDAVDVAIPPPVDPAPSVTGIDPPSVLQGEAAMVTVTGSGFVPGTHPDPGPGIQVSDVQHVDSGTLTALFTVPLQTAAGPRDLMVHNPDLQAGTLAGGFAVEERAGPRVDQVAPPQGARGARLQVSILGADLDPAAEVGFGGEVTVLSVQGVDPSELAVDIEIDPGATLGPRDVTVTNPDTLFDTLAGGFEVVLPPPPRVDAVFPTVLFPGMRQTVQLAGDGFRPGATVDVGAGSRILSVDVADIQSVLVRLYVEANAAPGPRTVTLTDTETGTGSLADAFDLDATPILRLAGLRALDLDPAFGNGSLRADPGETVELVPTLANEGNAPAAGPGLVLAVDPPVPGVRVVRAFVDLPEVAVGSAATRTDPPHLTIEVAAHVPCGTLVPLRLEAQPAGGGAQILRTVLPVGGPEEWRTELTLTGSPGDAVGASLAGLGDADGDRIADWAVGAPGRDVGPWTGAGRVLIFSGGGGDLLGEETGSADGEGVGASLAGPGDLDGDGLADVVIGTPEAAGGAGRVEARSSAGGGLLWMLEGVPGDRLGASLAGIGDANGDGVGDVVAGAPGASPGGLAGAGLVLLLSGPDGAVLDSREGEAQDESLGAAVSAAGDLDGDGLADWVVGAPGAGAGAGAVVARTLNADGGADLWVAAGESGEGLGAALAPGGDVDGDGFEEVAAGAPAARGGAGRLVALDRRGGETASLLGSPGEALGSAVAAAGDADGDGRGDLWVGAPGALAGAGEVQLLSPEDGRLLDLLQGDTASRFGAVLAGPGDLGGDGWPDLLAGSPDADPAGRTDGGEARRIGSVAACREFVPCDDDGLEHNDVPAAAAAIPFQERLEGLVLCRDDQDWYRVDLPDDGGLAARVLFDPAEGDLDLFLLREDETLLDASLGDDGVEEVSAAALPSGSYLLLVQGPGGGPVPYALETLDPASCTPVHEVDGLRVAQAPWVTELRWEPVGDVCHTVYAAYASPSAVPLSGGVFPDDPPFARLPDLDGDDADASALVDAPGGVAFFLVVSLGTSDETGPSGHY